MSHTELCAYSPHVSVSSTVGPETVAVLNDVGHRRKPTRNRAKNQPFTAYHTRNGFLNKTEMIKNFYNNETVKPKQKHQYQRNQYFHVHRAHKFYADSAVWQKCAFSGDGRLPSTLKPRCSRSPILREQNSSNDHTGQTSA